MPVGFVVPGVFVVEGVFVVPDGFVVPFVRAVVDSFHGKSGQAGAWASLYGSQLFNFRKRSPTSGDSPQATKAQLLTQHAASPRILSPVSSTF